jgi:hypothetical protein
MSLATFRKALQLCEDFGCIPFIGGGEPTLHPQFEQMLCEAIPVAAEQGGKLGVITNGGITRRAKMIASLTKAGVIHGELSQDEYHDEIDEDVVNAFVQAGEKLGHFHNAIRDTSAGHSRDPLPHGRAVEMLGLNYHDEDCLEDPRDEGDCPCPDWMVYPDGTIHQCGCDNSPQVGHVSEGIESPHADCFHAPDWVNACIDNDAEHLLYA